MLKEVQNFVKDTMQYYYMDIKQFCIFHQIFVTFYSLQGEKGPLFFEAEKNTFIHSFIHLFIYLCIVKERKVTWEYTAR